MVAPQGKDHSSGRLGTRQPFNGSRGVFAHTTSTFSHIQLAPPSSSASVSVDKPVPFVRKNSLQAEIESGLGISSLTDSTASTYRAPTSFAEAAAMPRGNRGSDFKGGPSASANEEFPALSRPATHSSMLQLRVPKKKNKKWAPFDLAALETETRGKDVESVATPHEAPDFPTVPPSPVATSLSLSSFTLGTFAEALSGSPSKPVVQSAKLESAVSISTTSTHQIQLRGHAQNSSLVVPDKNKHLVEPVHDPDPTPTRAAFAKFPSPSNSALGTFGLGKERLTLPEDSDSTKDKLEGVMSRFGTAFDADEWDSELSQADENNSPEPLTVKPQTVTYTTVGSKATHEPPKFNPPIRMQRDNAARRPLQTTGQIRSSGQESFFAGKTPTQAGMGFGFDSPHSSRHNNSFFNAPDRSQRVGPALENAENDAFLRQAVTGPPATRDDSTLTPRPSFAPASITTDGYNKINNDHFGRSSGHLGLLKGDQSNQVNSTHLLYEQRSQTIPGQFSTNASTQSSLSVLDKMQTIQRLASYPNPMQQSAKNRLSEFALGKIRDQDVDLQESRSFLNTPSGISSEQTGRNFMTDFQMKEEEQRRGSLDYSFRFPGSRNEDQSQLRPESYYGRGSSSMFTPRESFYPQNQVPPGYPQPLTAGPPGQRPIMTGVKREQAGSSMSATSQPFIPQASIQRSGLSQGMMTSNGAMPQPVEDQQFTRPSSNYPPNYPWAVGPIGTAPRPFSSKPSHEKEIRNTAPYHEIAKYYPNGFPADMNAEFNYLSRREMNQNLGLEPERTSDEETGKKRDDWWYGGVRNFQKDANSHLTDLNLRNMELIRGHAIAPAMSPRPFDKEETLSVRQINDMTDAECAQPLIDGLFGSLLSYANEHDDPNSLRRRSRFYDPPLWMIDNTDKGRKTYYGSDIGPTPKRIGRDPRYQHTTEDQGSRWGP